MFLHFFSSMKIASSRAGFADKLSPAAEASGEGHGASELGFYFLDKGGDNASSFLFLDEKKRSKEKSLAVE